MTQPRLNLRHLAFFRTLAETANFTTAAERCGVSQPGLSAAIRQFETDLGVRLFDRDTRNVSLTAEGEALLPLAEATLINAERAAQEIRDLVATKRNHPRIASVSSVTSFLLPQALAAFDHASAKVRPVVIDADNGVVKSLVSQGEADIGIGLGPFDPDLFCETLLFADELQLVVSTQHPLAGRAEASWQEVRNLGLVTYQPSSHVYRMIVRTFDFHGLHFVPAGTYNFRQTIIGLALAGEVAAVLPSLSLEQTLPATLRRIRLVDPTVRRHFFLVTRKDRELPAITMALVAYLKRVLLQNSALQPDSAALRQV